MEWANRAAVQSVLSQAHAKIAQAKTWHLVLGGAATVLVINYAKQTIFRSRKVSA